jgi:PAS domain S-box-containing protein
MAFTYDEMSKAELIAALCALQADPRLQAPSSESEQLLHDLQVHQIELEMQNRELREAQQLLEESRARYADLYDFAPVVYFTLGRDGRIQEANLTAAALFRMERGTLVGSPLTALLSVENQQAFRAHLRRCFTEKVRVTTELTFSVRGAGPVVAQMVSTPVLGPEDQVTGCKTTLTDISALKRSEEKLRLLAQASAVLASSFDYAATLAEVVRLTVPLLADICFVDLGEESRQESQKFHRVEVAFADPQKQSLADAVRHLAPSPRGKSPQAQVLRSGEPILLAECTAARLYTAIADGLEHETLIKACYARSLMFVPLVARERTLGVATFVMAESGRRYSSADLVMAQDLAARAAMAIDNAQLYQDAQKAIRAREDILSVVSHDLKNPLVAIMLGATVLLHPSAQADAGMRQKSLEAINRSARQMNRIIGDLLDVSSIEAGHLSIQPGEHDLDALLNDALEALLPLAKQKGVGLTVNALGGSYRVLCDRERMLQVFSNLVGNAIKFTPAGGSIAMRAEIQEQNALVAIQDTGPGIPEQFLQHVFKRRWQARETAKNGLGLGLHIAKGIVEAQGGTIWVESRPGAGTTLFFTIPLVSTIPIASPASNGATA